MGLGVGGGHVPHVPALRVRYGREPQGAGSPDQVPVHPHPLWSETLEVRQLQLDDRRLGLHSLEDPQAKLTDGPGLGEGALAHSSQEIRRQVARVRVETHDDGAPLATRGGDEGIHR
jgi:hypothetical protein